MDGHLSKKHMNNHEYGIDAAFSVILLMRDIIDIFLEWYSVGLPLLAHHLHECTYSPLRTITGAIKKENHFRTDINKHTHPVFAWFVVRVCIEDNPDFIFSVFYKPHAVLSNVFILIVIVVLTTLNFNKLKRYLNEKQA